MEANRTSQIERRRDAGSPHPQIDGSSIARCIAADSLKDWCARWFSGQAQLRADSESGMMAAPRLSAVFHSPNNPGPLPTETMFVSEDGTISGWRSSLGTTAETLVPGSSANVYKGAAFGTIGGNSYLYAANFRAGTIDVEKGSAAAPSLPGTFADPNLPSGFAPFNVQNLGGTLYVTYAQQDATKHDEVAGAGLGLVNSYDLQGHLLGRVATAGTLNAPWGLAIAPGSFGAMAGALLVGNFGDGRINAYNAATHAFLGQVQDVGGGPLDIDGLWAISPGNGANGGSNSLLYFTAGPDDESHGIFGVLTPTPEPSVTVLLMVGLSGLMFLTRRRAFGTGSAPSPHAADGDVAAPGPADRRDRRGQRAAG